MKRKWHYETPLPRRRTGMEMTFVFFDFEVLCIDEKTGSDVL